MAEIVFINPSPNILKLQRKISLFGKDVVSVRTKGFYNLSCKRLFYFYGGLNVFFTTSHQGEQDREDRVFLFKRNILSRLKVLGLTRDLKLLSPELVAGNIVDLMVFKRSELLENDEDNDVTELEEFATVSDVVDKYSNAKIYTSTLLNSGTTKLSLWETDYDLEETLGNDYFVMFNGFSKIELFVHEGKIATITKGKNAIEELAAIIPSIKKFSFKQLSEINILRNVQTWEKDISTPKVTLLNDYSYFNCSISMPQSWYERLANHINFSKK